MPKRIQLRRSKGWRKPEGCIVVARPSKWGNPIRVGKEYRDAATRAEAVERYRRALALSAPYRNQIRRELGGHDLACWCPLDQPCHADVLLEIANSPFETEVSHV